MESRAVLLAAWTAAAGSKDFPGLEGRQQALSTLVSLLTAAFPEPWFESFATDQITVTYPKQHRCLLDATLQRFIALSPLHCCCILQGFLSLPNSQTLNSFFRRDLAVLFKAPEQVSSLCWPQQGAVACSIISYLARDTAKHLWYAQLQQSRPVLDREMQQAQAPEERLGTAIGWLTDCLLQADWHQSLLLFQLVLATVLTEHNHLDKHSSSQPGSDGVDILSATAAKRQCRESGFEFPPASHRQQQHVADDTADDNSSSLGQRSVTSLCAGMYILTSICCCEQLQYGTKSLIPAAAVASSAAAGSNTTHAVQLAALEAASWLHRQLAVQITSSPASETAGSAAIGNTEAVQQGSVTAISPSFQPADGLGLVLQQLAYANPLLVVPFVCILMGLTATVSAAVPPSSATSGISQVPQGSAELECSLQQQQQPLMQQQWLLQAAKQWQMPLSAAVTGARGRKPKRMKQQTAVAAASVNSSQASVQQLLSDMPTVKATWLCKHVVPILTQQATDAWQQREQSHRQVLPPTAVALAQLLAEGHLLLPAAGEVLVSARFLAEALNALLPDLQAAVASTWKNQLLKLVSASAAEQSAKLEPQQGHMQTTGSMAHKQTVWKKLQPMLCLLSHLEANSPFAHALAAAVMTLLVDDTWQQAPSTFNTAASYSSICREVLRHLLLPVRFAVTTQGRVWLLRQLLLLHEQDEQSGEAEAAVQPDVSSKVAAELVMKVLQQIMQQEKQVLVRGMQLLRAGVDAEPVAEGIGNSSVHLAQDRQARDLGMVLLQLLTAAKQAVSRMAVCTTSEDHHGCWLTTVERALEEIVQASSTAASTAQLVGK